MNNCSEAGILVMLLLTLGFLWAGPVSHWSNAEKRTVCSSHLQQLYQVMEQYLADSDDWYPPSIIRKSTWVYWPELLKPYYKDFQQLSCPANPRGEAAFDSDDLLPSLFSLSLVSYGMNYYLSPSGEPSHSSWVCRRSLLADPTYVIILGDAQGKGMQLRPTSCWLQDWAPFHEQGANFLLADGHVEWHNQQSLGLHSPPKGWKKDIKRWRNWKTEK
jgi:prepilin-type processing-associated H-X9-DG protein